MADDKKDEKKDDKKKDEPKKKDAKPEGEAIPAAAGGGKGALIGIIAGVAVLVGVGVGVGAFFAKSLTPAAVEKPAAKAAAAEGGHGGAEGHGGEEAKGSSGEAGAEGAAHGNGKGLIEEATELEPIQIKSNITGSGGTRYVTFNVFIWVPNADKTTIEKPPVRHLMQAKIEESVSTYQLEDLNSPTIRDRMSKFYATQINQMLRSVMPGRPADKPFILEVKITDLLNQ